ncbi:hypothetical protein VSS92_28120, partial [Pseudomonas syringae pv. tagetis]
MGVENAGDDWIFKGEGGGEGGGVVWLGGGLVGGGWLVCGCGGGGFMVLGFWWWGCVFGGCVWSGWCGGCGGAASLFDFISSGLSVLRERLDSSCP